MRRAHVENEKGERIELTNSPYWDVRIEGLTPGSATINTTTIAGKDGSVFNSARKNEKEIIITAKPKFPVAENRQRLYKYFKTKKEVKIYYETTNRKVKINGHVSGIEGLLFEQTQAIEISILCEDPYFVERTERNTEMSSTQDLFEFPFEIEEEGIEFSIIEKTISQNIKNEGDTETGMIIELTATGEVVNPTIYNVETRGHFGLKIELQTGDVVRINTNNLRKRVTLIRYAEERNAINSIIKGNEWFKLMPGDNVFTYKCDKGEENLSIKFIYSNKYEGV